jgi:hypothetical protein
MAHSFSTVCYGSTGTDVVVLQTVLSMLHYVGADGKPLTIDGDCRTNTVHAINSFQASMRAYGFECGTNGKNDSAFGQACWKLLGVT